MRCCCDWRSQDESPAVFYDKLRSSVWSLPLLYGLPKVHKPEVRLHPIMSSCGPPPTSCQSISQLSCPPCKEPVILCPDFIKPQVLTSNELLAIISFDVVSLFTNVPIHLATEVAQCRLRGDADLNDRTGLSVEEVMKLLEFCLSSTFLSFHGGINQQTFGTAMGSPVSVTIGNLVMEDMEERALATTDVLLRLWKCYVDDTCVALRPQVCSSSWPPQWGGTQHTIHSWLGVRRLAPIFECPPPAGHRWLHLVDCIQESHPHGPLPQHYVPPCTHWPTNLRWSRHCMVGAEAICSDVTAKYQDQAH